MERKAAPNREELIRVLNHYVHQRVRLLDGSQVKCVCISGPVHVRPEDLYVVGETLAHEAGEVLGFGGKILVRA